MTGNLFRAKSTNLTLEINLPYLKHVTLVLAILVMALTLPTVHARIVTMVTVDWAPHYGAELPENGLMTALTVAAFKAGGHEARIEFIPWPRALKEVKEGKYDIVMGAYVTDERREIYHMSKPVYHLDTGLIARPGLNKNKFKSLRELSPYSIGVSRGYANSEAFDAAEYLDKHPAKGPVLNMRKLFRGRLDMMVASFDLFRYNAKKEGFCIGDIEFVSPPLARNGLFIMGSRSVPDGGQIIADFNRGLDTIRENGSFDSIVNRFRR